VDLVIALPKASDIAVCMLCVSTTILVSWDCIKVHVVSFFVAVQQKNREMFEPFIEDEVPFDEYCQSMEKDGRWAGHMELQAASLVTHNNICIHRVRPSS